MQAEHPWLAVSPRSGFAPSTITVTLDVTELEKKAGYYGTEVTIEAAPTGSVFSTKVEVYVRMLGDVYVLAGADEGTLTNWLKSDGDTLEFDEDLCEIRRSQKGGNPKAERWPRSDKITINAPVAGVLEKTFVKEGETVNANKPLCMIGDGSTLDNG